MCVCVCVCVCERERERGGAGGGEERERLCACVRAYARDYRDIAVSMWKTDILHSHELCGFQDSLNQIYLHS